MFWDSIDTFSDIIASAARLYGNKIAFKDRLRALSFAAYEAEVLKLAAALDANGIKAGARIAVYSQGRVEVAVILGLCAAGYVPVPLNWRLSVTELSALLDDCEPSVLFIEDRYISALPSLASSLDGCAIVSIGSEVSGLDYYQDLLDEEVTAARWVGKPDDPACMIYTSGTTGHPKGAVLSHRGVVLNCKQSCEEAIRFTFDDVTLMVMPLFHVGGVWYYLFPSFASGCTTLIRERFELDDVIHVCKAERVTVIHVVPTMLSELLEHPEFSQAASELNLIVYAGSSMPLDLLRKALDRFSKCGFAQAYGSTEGGIISSLDPAAHRAALENPEKQQVLKSCGKPLRNTEVAIERSGSDPADPVGEILVKSLRLMDSYWKLPLVTADRIEQGWLKTGDLGFFDGDGYLHIVDRKNDMVISGGENIYPFEVEEVLRSHPDVKEASVFGIPDVKWVERLVAAIILVPGKMLSEKDLIAFARERLPGYKTPKKIFFVEQLPKNTTGKVLRKDLRESFSTVVC